ncbi:ABC transporter ATP-binding protein [Microvirga puerhi]|uniref:Dipeptide ABC transporter ATP-binding protein n=1 Tax=Microvirga puerhi TaxID=2876078 RepID=A0ABS7VTP9_9HYPH|nr:dipeptide ABC transporter ATP-binding protein [Microvirga puerhi]MBZ6078263.1 dipeptide ABC transporter ATP-binding protein [Microvirga puerhi]
MAERVNATGHEPDGRPPIDSDSGGASAGPQPLLVARGLVRHFPLPGGLFRKSERSVKAVDGVDLMIGAGETLGLVGESGCGKSTLGRMLVRLDEPSAGEILFDGHNISTLREGELKEVRRRIQMVFQNPFSSLNPRKSIGDTISEPLIIHGIGDADSRHRRVLELLDIVGLRREHYQRYPHQFSGGQRQRIGIARAFALKPKLIVCDEPVSALDVSIQSQILNLIEDLQQAFGVSYLFISHDLRVVEHVSDRVAVMYLGRVVEEGSTADLYRSPRHPYTQALLAAVPIPDPAVAQPDSVLEGGVPNPIDPPRGCHFHPRCPLAVNRCRAEMPPLMAEGSHKVRCWVNAPAAYRSGIAPG